MITEFFNRFDFTSGTGAKTIFFIAVALISTNTCLWFFNRYLKNAAREENNSVAGIFFATISVLYSLILAFVIMAEWDDYNALDQTIIQESDKLNSIIAHSGRLGDSLKKFVGNSLSKYCEQVINSEWEMRDRESVDNPSAIPALRQMLLNSTPANELEANVLQVMDENLSAISDLRRERLSHTRSQLPPLIWPILEAGAVLLICFSFFFKMQSAILQNIYISLFVCLLTMCLSIVYNLDHPFSPDSGVDAGPYQRLLAECRRLMHLSNNVIIK